MAGRLIYLMGPSGAGKDTVLKGVVQMMGGGAWLAPRVVTRPASLTEERMVPVSEDEFLRMENRGFFAMAWRANGLAYGVMQHIHEKMAGGIDVFVNGSRGYLPEACRRYPDLLPVFINVDLALIRERLVARGRESMAEIEARLDRNASFHARADVPASALHIDNSHDPADAIRSLHAQLHETATARHG